MLIAVVLTWGLASSPAGARAFQNPSAGRLTAPAAPATPANVGFGVQAAQASRVDARPNFQYGGGPGAVINDHVAVVNIGREPLNLDLFPADAATSTDGQFQLKLQADKQSGVGSWITIDGPQLVSIPARTSKGPTVRIFPFRLTIPANASPGDHVGAILVGLRVAANPQNKTSLGLDQRIGIRVYLRVSGPVHPALSVLGFKARYKAHDVVNPMGEGDADISYTVKNTGNVILGAKQTLSVSGLLSAKHASGLNDIPPLLPGDSVTVHTTVRNVLPQFRLTAKVRLHPAGQVGEVDPGIKDTSASKHFWAIPWALIVVIILLLGMPFGVRWYLRYRSRRSYGGRHGPAPSPDRVPVGSR